MNNKSLPDFYNQKSDSVISVSKENGTDVWYYLFNDFEIHYNEIHPKTHQEWHAHKDVDEILFIISGTICYQWKEDTVIKDICLSEKEMVRVNRSIHRLENKTTQVVSFVVFRKKIGCHDDRELFKNDKQIFE